jgi:gluconate 5-dehydrogenase
MGNPLFDLTGRVALVSGAAQGLGFAMAKGLGQAGATLVINGRSEEKVARALSALVKEDVKAHASIFDVRDVPRMREQIAVVERDIGPIHILVNNAGIQRRMPLEQFEDAAWHEVLETNLTGLFRLTREVVQGMIGRRSGKIINVCSLMCEAGRPTVGAYTAAKGGVKMLTKAMAVEWGKYNIQANGIGPGYFTTEMNRPLYENPQFDGWIKSRTPMGRWGDPNELAGTAVFLASPASDFVTGQVVYVDGGILAAL